MYIFSILVYGYRIKPYDPAYAGLNSNRGEVYWQTSQLYSAKISKYIKLGNSIFQKL